MLIGSVYRLRVTNIPLQEGLEVFPTIEVIDRLYPPVGQEFRFPIPIELTQEELEMALDGKFVTRVIYLEEPDAALPVAAEAATSSRTSKRPTATIRWTWPTAWAGRWPFCGWAARVPDAGGPDDTFLYGSPPLLKWKPTQRKPAADSAAVRGRRHHGASAAHSAESVASVARGRTTP